jgi:hypothetical protein
MVDVAITDKNVEVHVWDLNRNMQHNKLNAFK